MEISGAFWKLSSEDLVEWLLDYHNPWKANWNDPRGHSRNDYFPHSKSCFTFETIGYFGSNNRCMYSLKIIFSFFNICLYIAFYVSVSKFLKFSKSILQMRIQTIFVRRYAGKGVSLFLMSISPSAKYRTGSSLNSNPHTTFITWIIWIVLRIVCNLMNFLFAFFPASKSN